MQTLVFLYETPHATNRSLHKDSPEVPLTAHTTLQTVKSEKVPAKILQSYTLRPPQASLPSWETKLTSVMFEGAPQSFTVNGVLAAPELPWLCTEEGKKGGKG